MSRKTVEKIVTSPRREILSLTPWPGSGAHKRVMMDQAVKTHGSSSKGRNCFGKPLTSKGESRRTANPTRTGIRRSPWEKG
jgi:hypothetical protein